MKKLLLGERRDLIKKLNRAIVVVLIVVVAIAACYLTYRVLK